MNDNNINKPSEVDWARFGVMTDEMIDTSEIPPLTEEFFKKATWRMPAKPVSVTIEVEVELDTLAWFKAQGEDYPQRLAAALRLYANTHRDFEKEYSLG